MTRCSRCDHENPDGVEICESCGAAVPAASDQSSDTDPDDNDTVLAQQIGEMLAKGQKIAAIKLYREATGTGLKEAKDAIDALAAKHNIPSAGGCAGTILCAVGLAALLLALVW